jgi:predicted Zn-dependent protease
MEETMSRKKTDVRLFTRREALKLTAGGAAGFLAGCAVNPVTGEQQLMLISREQEIALDKKQSPHQFSADYGPVQDSTVNNYVSSVGNSLARTTHRPDMPYSFRCVNANYVNAYAFPGGSIACTRGILLKLDNEAELAALLGHELGHVNARHTASRVSSSMATQGLLSIGVGVIATQSSELAPLAAGLGGVGAGLLLASYSRDDERQADSLGMEYMDYAGYDPQGMVGLMDMLNGLHESDPSFVQQMFASHPMSSERYETAVTEARTTYGGKKGKLLRERYMDNIASIRKDEPAIKEMQDGEGAMKKKAFADAQTHFAKALDYAPNDYAGLLLMAKCKMARNQQEEGLRYAEKARRIYPQEPQAMHLAGMLQLEEGRYRSALRNFQSYEKNLPGNPSTIFFSGYAYEALGNREMAANHYYRYLQATREGDAAKHAYSRLDAWGYIK